MHVKLTNLFQFRACRERSVYGPYMIRVFSVHGPFMLHSNFRARFLYVTWDFLRKGMKAYCIQTDNSSGLRLALP